MIDNIDKILKSGTIPPVILLFGEEEFLVEEAMNKIVKSLCKTETDLYNLDMLDGEECDLMRIADICSSYPLMSDRRVVVVKRFDSLFSGRGKKADSGTPFAKYLDKPSPSTLLLLVSSEKSISGISSQLSKQSAAAQKKIDGFKFPYNVLLSKHEWKEFPKMYESSFPAFIVKRFAQEGKECPIEAAELLAVQTPPSLRDLHNEIEKVSLYAAEKKVITSDDVLAVTGSSRKYNPFELQKALGARNLNESLKILNNILAVSREEMLIISVLTTYFTKIWKTIECAAMPPAQLAGVIGVSPYFTDEYKNAAKKYKPEDINNAFLVICETDTALKSGTTDNLLAMNQMIINIVEGRKS